MGREEEGRQPRRSRRAWAAVASVTSWRANASRMRRRSRSHQNDRTPLPYLAARHTDHRGATRRLTRTYLKVAPRKPAGPSTGVLVEGGSCSLAAAHVHDGGKSESLERARSGAGDRHAIAAREAPALPEGGQRRPSRRHRHAQRTRSPPHKVAAPFWPATRLLPSVVEAVRAPPPLAPDAHCARPGASQPTRTPHTTTALRVPRHLAGADRRLPHRGGGPRGQALV